MYTRWFVFFSVPPPFSIHLFSTFSFQPPLFSFCLFHFLLPITLLLFHQLFYLLLLHIFLDISHSLTPIFPFLLSSLLLFSSLPSPFTFPTSLLFSSLYFTSPIFTFLTSLLSLPFLCPSLNPCSLLLILASLLPFFALHFTLLHLS